MTLGALCARIVLEMKKQWLSAGSWDLKQQVCAKFHTLMLSDLNLMHAHIHSFTSTHTRACMQMLLYRVMAQELVLFG